MTKKMISSDIPNWYVRLNTVRTKNKINLGSISVPSINEKEKIKVVDINNLLNQLIAVQTNEYLKYANKQELIQQNKGQKIQENLYNKIDAQLKSYEKICPNFIVCDTKATPCNDRVASFDPKYTVEPKAPIYTGTCPNHTNNSRYGNCPDYSKNGNTYSNDNKRTGTSGNGVTSNSRSNSNSPANGISGNSNSCPVYHASSGDGFDGHRLSDGFSSSYSQSTSYSTTSPVYGFDSQRTTDTVNSNISCSKDSNYSNYGDGTCEVYSTISTGYEVKGE